MIQIYKADNSNYDMNGDSVINPTKCILEADITGNWSVSMTHPLDDKAELIIENAVICADTFISKNQLFRIYDIEKDDSSITCSAYPIFFDSKNDCFLFDVRPTDKNGQEALNIMLAQNDKYSAESDITQHNTSYFIQKNFMEALNGNDENSFINRWGGEISYNNFKIIVNEKIGTDNGARAEFGYNLTGIKEHIDMTKVATRLIPTAYNGYTLPDNETVDSININKYPIIYTRVVKYDDIKLKEDASENDEENGVTVCDNLEILYEELRKRAKLEFENGIDVPLIDYEVNMLDLSKIEEYKQFKNLIKIGLGDVVHIKHKRLNIETSARLISLEYNLITQENEQLTLGDYRISYFDNVGSVISSVEKVIDTTTNTVMGEKIAGVIDLLTTSLKAQKDIAKKQDVRAILFEDLDPESPTFGALCIGTQGLQVAKKRDEDNSDWIWGTAINFEGIIANYVIAGIIADKLGKNYWDLDNGKLVTKDMIANNATITGILNGAIINGGKINGTDISTEKDISIGRNINLAGDANSIFAVLMAGRTVLRFIGGSVPTTSVDGTNVQLLADNHILIDGRSISSSVPISTGSDKRLKTNINDIDISSLIDNLKIKSFDYKKGIKNVVGVVAQDLQSNEFSKYILRENTEGILSVDYNALFIACIQRVQKLSEKIKDMEENISENNS